MGCEGWTGEHLRHPDPAGAGERLAYPRQRCVGAAQGCGLRWCPADRDVGQCGQAVRVGGGERPQRAITRVDHHVTGPFLRGHDLVELAEPVSVADGTALGQLDGQADQHHQHQRRGGRRPAERGECGPREQRGGRDAEHDVAEV
jgi:hypothetical protein